MSPARAARRRPLLAGGAARPPTTARAEAPPASAQTVLGEATLALPLEGVIDFAAERARIEKELSKLDGEIMRLEKKLSNEKFVANAPEAVVAEQREKLDDYKNQKAKMGEALERLQGM